MVKVFIALRSLITPNLPGSLMLFPIQPTRSAGFFLYGETQNKWKNATKMHANAKGHTVHIEMRKEKSHTMTIGITDIGMSVHLAAFEQVHT